MELDSWTFPAIVMLLPEMALVVRLYVLRTCLASDAFPEDGQLFSINLTTIRKPPGLPRGSVDLVVMLPLVNANSLREKP